MQASTWGPVIWCQICCL